MGTERTLEMHDAQGGVIQVAIDLDSIHGIGGFGAVYAAPTDPDVVYKCIPLSIPRPVGDAAIFVAHIRRTRERLQWILDEEERSGSPRPFIVASIREIVDQSLSTHWAFDLDPADCRLRAVWYRQRRAPGTPLSLLFRTLGSPSPSVRVGIAQGFIARMRTLRRADLVHLDPHSDNVFVDDRQKVTLIDLDGCGVACRDSHGEPKDQWEYPPLTLGHLSQVRVPLWYPQERLSSGPMSGNYIFGERWAVLDTVIRILSWNSLNVLGWVDATTRSKIGRYADVRSWMDAEAEAGRQCGVLEWRTYYQSRLVEARDALRQAAQVVPSTSHPACLQTFMRIAEAAYVDPGELRAPSGGGGFYAWYDALLR